MIDLENDYVKFIIEDTKEQMRKELINAFEFKVELINKDPIEVIIGYQIKRDHFFYCDGLNKDMCFGKKITTSLKDYKAWNDNVYTSKDIKRDLREN